MLNKLDLIVAYHNNWKPKEIVFDLRRKCPQLIEKSTKPKNYNKSNEMIKNFRVKCMSCMRTNLLTLLTLIGVVAGCVLGIILRSSRDGTWTEREVSYIQFVGDLFLRILKGLVLPLIVTTLIAAIGDLDLSVSGKMARVGGIYYVITTTIAIVLGIVLAVTIKPGANRSGDTGNVPEISVRNVTTVDTLLDLVRNMFPPNYVQACTQQYQTVLKAPVGYDERKLVKR